MSISPPQNKPKQRTTDLSVQISDLLIETVLDRAFITDTFEINSHAHTHPYYELHIGLHGEYKICFANEKTILMQPTMVCLIPPETRHHTEKLAENTQNLAVRFTYQRVNEQKKYAPLYNDFHRAMSFCTSPFTEESLQIFQLVSALRRETLSGRTGSDILENLLLAEVYISLLRLLLPAETLPSGKMPLTDNLNTRYIKIESFLEEHFHEPITQNDLANALFLGTRQLSRILKSIYGLSFREKLTEMRLSKALELLTETELPSETISEMIGYNSYSGFYLAFRKKYGVSVSDFRKRLKNKT